MRKLVVCNIISLDGYYEGPDRGVMPLPLDPIFDRYNAERLRAADTLLLGRESYEGFKGFWPSVADDPTPRWNDTRRELSAIDKVVVSDTLTADQTAPWQDNTRIVRRADAYDWITWLKCQPGGDILMFGSHTLWNDLLAHSLVDELHLMIGNTTLGGGTPIFSCRVDRSLKLADVIKWPESNNLLARYVVDVA